MPPERQHVAPAPCFPAFWHHIAAPKLHTQQIDEESLVLCPHDAYKTVNFLLSTAGPCRWFLLSELHADTQ